MWLLTHIQPNRGIISPYDWFHTANMQMRRVSLDQGVPTAILSRQMAGSCGKALVVNLPGSEKNIPQWMRVCVWCLYAVHMCVYTNGRVSWQTNNGKTSRFGTTHTHTHTKTNTYTQMAKCCGRSWTVVKLQKSTCRHIYARNHTSMHACLHTQRDTPHCGGKGFRRVQWLWMHAWTKGKLWPKPSWSVVCMVLSWWYIFMVAWCHTMHMYAHESMHAIHWAARCTFSAGKPGSIRTCLDAVFPAIPYCIDLLGGPYLEGNEAKVKVFRPPNKWAFTRGRDG